MAKIRIRIAGIYQREGKILLVKHKKGKREYFLLPGGGQEPGESQKQALAREWQEELGVSVTVGDFLFCGESVPPPGLIKSQVLQLVHRIDSIEGVINLIQDGPLVDFSWVKIDMLEDIVFFPGCLVQIKAYLKNEPVSLYEKYQWLT